MTCAKAQEFLAKHHVEVSDVGDAKKTTLGPKDALDLLHGVDELYVSKRKQVTHVSLKKDKPDEETLRELLPGPTGNLRAPTFRIGRTLVVGFDEATYRKLFK